MEKFEIENETINLENAENLLLLYCEFLDDECPTENELDNHNEDAMLKAWGYATRSKMYRSSILAAFDIIRAVRKRLYEGVCTNE